MKKRIENPYNKLIPDGISGMTMEAYKKGENGGMNELLKKRIGFQYSDCLDNSRVVKNR